jgi:hypothetical protein
MYEGQQFSLSIVTMDVNYSHTLRTGGKGDDTTSKDMERHHNPEIWITLSVSD